MIATYAKRALKDKGVHGWIIVLMVAIPLGLGFMYGLMYESLFKASLYEPTASIAVSPLVHVISVANRLDAVAKMQLSLFTGSTFFFASLFASQFMKLRHKNITNRLVSMGYNKKHVYLGEGLSYFSSSFAIIGVYQVAFVHWHRLSLSFTPKMWIGFLGLMVLQAAFASAYALFALGVFRTEKVFALYHFLPAFIISFLGGAFFPVDQVGNGGVYEWMPTYHLNRIYDEIYTLGQFDLNMLSLPYVVLTLSVAILTAIGYTQFKLEEVAS